MTTKVATPFGKFICNSTADFFIQYVYTFESENSKDNYSIGDEKDLEAFMKAFYKEQEDND